MRTHANKKISDVIIKVNIAFKLISNTLYKVMKCYREPTLGSDDDKMVKVLSQSADTELWNTYQYTKQIP